jgi:hypothetical protein
MAATFTLAGVGVAFGNAKHMLSLFNGAGSGRVLRVKRIWVLNNQVAGVTGVLTTWAVRRTSAQSAGTSIAPTKHDTASSNLPAQVLAATGATVTNTGDVQVRTFVWSNDEPAASSGTNDEFQCLIPLNCVFDAATGDTDIEPLTLREGQGLTVQHTGSSTVGVADIFIEFTDSAT